MRKKKLEFLPRLEYVSLKIESTLSSARDADDVLTEEIRCRIKKFLQNSLKNRDYVKTGGHILNSGFRIIGAILQDDLGKKLGEVANEINEEQKIDKDRINQKFDRAINKIDSMPANRLIQIMKILKKHELESILDNINAEYIQATVLRKRNLKIIL
jgi:hypothetical protein